MWTKKRITAVGTGTTLGAIAIIAIMVIPGLFPIFQSETIQINVNTSLPFTEIYYSEKTMTLKFIEVSREITLVAYFEVDEIPPN
ncbi:MAG: hypothetical protein Q7J68_01375, partial [Thermoplasmata archaeon]|nr:hypothetical protein [Thermoplasmata archaeon]